MQHYLQKNKLWWTIGGSPTKATELNLRAYCDPTGSTMVNNIMKADKTPAAVWETLKQTFKKTDLMTNASTWN